DPAGLASDIAGAIDVATRMAEVSYSTVTAAGKAAIDGLEKNMVPLSGFVVGGNGFPSAIKKYHYSTLKQSTFTWRGNDYDYHEELVLGSVSTSHDFAVDKVNGTEKIIIPSGEVKYKFVFDKLLNITASTGKGTISDPEYNYPISINLLGKQFIIVGVGGNSVKMLSGSVGTATPTTPVTYGAYSVYSDLGAGGTGGWARVIIKDSAGNTVDTLIIDVGGSKESTVTGLTIKLLAVRALQDGTIVGADLVVGPTGAIEKTYTTSCDITSTGTEDKKFPGETEWCIQVASGDFAANGAIQKNDEIEVVYKPTDTKYLSAGEKLVFPNNYGEFGFLGFNTNYFVTVTITPFTEKTVYNANSPSTSLGTWSGIEIASDVAGSLRRFGESDYYGKLYLLFQKSPSDAQNVSVGYWDPVNQKILVDPTDANFYKSLNATNKDAFSVDIEINYGGSSAFAKNISIVVNNSEANIINKFEITNAVKMAYQNKTVWSTATLPTFRLYTSDSADDQDVVAATSGENNANDNIGKASQDVVTDAGIIVVSPGSYSGSQIVKIKVPAEQLYVDAYVGKLGSTAQEGTYKVIKPITAAVAVLDKDVTNAHRAKNIISIGGPCVNRITAEALGLTYPACGAASTVPANAAMIKIVDNVFTPGKSVVVVAGWEAANTRTACSVLQNYDTLLTHVKDQSSVKITAATQTGITPL
ncbi:MAG: S-layer protein, partial [Candidatus Aenigmatarchaeota archaeon]